ncbi:hypothetical protein [Streptomyces sp. NPDC054834]
MVAAFGDGRHAADAGRRPVRRLCPGDHGGPVATAMAAVAWAVVAGGMVRGMVAAFEDGHRAADAGSRAEAGAAPALGALIGSRAADEGRRPVRRLRLGGHRGPRSGAAGPSGAVARLPAYGAWTDASARLAPGAHASSSVRAAASSS